MDALFLPLASAVGASVDQIKVCFRVSNCSNVTQTQTLFDFVAHLLSSCLLSIGKRLHPSSTIEPQLETPFQHRCYGILSRASLEPMVWPSATAGQYFGYILYC
jgi:hypothetical protein